MQDTMKEPRYPFLEGKRIVLCVTGSIAAVETVRLARELRRRGAIVHGVMSAAARDILTPAALAFATGGDVVTAISGQVEHVALCGSGPGHADCIVVCPCTANTAAKIAAGVADTPPTLCVATGLSHMPVIVVPAMHESMAGSPAHARVRKELGGMGIHLLDGPVAEGKHKMAPLEDIIAAVGRAVGPHDLDGATAVVTAGSTMVPIDGIRHIANRSTGKMGVAMARELHRRGADVVLVAGMMEPQHVPVPVIRALHSGAVQEELLAGPERDIYVMAMAVSDFILEPVQGKLDSHREHTITLRPAEKILSALRRRTQGCVVGFKAAYGVTDEGLAEAAVQARSASGADIVVANDVGRPDRGFAASTNEVCIADATGGVSCVPLAGKDVIAARIADAIVRHRTAAHGL